MNLYNLCEYFGISHDYSFGSSEIVFINENNYRLICPIMDMFNPKHLTQKLYGFYQTGPTTQWFEGGVT